MPIKIDAPIRRFSQDEFAEISFEVMRVAFDVHNVLGRFCEEGIYESAIASRIPGSRQQVLAELTFHDFTKPYRLDLLVGGGGLFEMKTTETLSPRHRAQLMNYLLITEISHGKLINFRPERVEHEFINAHLTRAARQQFEVDVVDWNSDDGAPVSIPELMVPLLRDWGTCLELPAYFDAVTHFLGGKEQVLQRVPVTFEERHVGTQEMHLCGPESVVKITCLDVNGQRDFEDHARRLLLHTPLKRMQWINITRDRVAFRSIRDPAKR